MIRIKTRASLAAKTQEQPMSDERETPIDHPALAKYPDSPTALVRVDGGPLYRVPVRRDRDEAVPVPVNDLMQARTAIHQLRVLLASGAGDDFRIQTLAETLTHTTADPTSQTRKELEDYLRGLWERINGCLPYW